jgi:arylsulfatase A-like enzyme
MEHNRVLYMTRFFFRLIILGALGGTLAGLVSVCWLVLDNLYLGQGLYYLASQSLTARINNWAIGGALVMIFIWPIVRLILRKWRYGVSGATAAVPVVTIYVGGGWYVNHYYLPSLFSVPSITANLVFTGIAALLWYGLTLLIERFRAKPYPLKFLQGRAPVFIVVTALIATQLTRLLVPPAIDRPKTNVLVVLVDALRHDRLGIYGYTRPTSPNLDALAREGWVFTNAIAPAPWTKPSVASLFTSLYPRQHGISKANWGHRDEQGMTRVQSLSNRLITLAEVMANAGYRTGAFGRNHHLIPELGFAQGFETYEMMIRELRQGEIRHFAREINRHFMEWLSDSQDGFFAYLHHLDVHWPYHTPAPFAGLYAGKQPDVDYNSTKFVEWIRTEDRKRHDSLKLETGTVQHMSDAYDEGIQFVDTELGHLFRELKARGLYDNTLIIITADHGEEFFEHGHLLHGTSLYDELLRVPLIIKFPCPGPNCAPRTIAEQVELVDLMPTILSAVGSNVPRDVVGRDLTSVKAPKREFAFSEMGDRIALRTNQFKFIYNLESFTEELYDLQTDPNEQKNLAKEDRDLTATFVDRMFQWLAEIDVKPTTEGKEVIADENMLEKLRSLGYIE